jgi:hypothetical protein
MSAVRLKRRLLKLILSNRLSEIRYAMEGEIYGRKTKIPLLDIKAFSCQFRSSVGGATTEFNSCDFHCTCVLFLK